VVLSAERSCLYLPTVEPSVLSRMSEEKQYQQGKETLIKSIGNESDAEASQPPALDTRETGITGTTVFDISSNNSHLEDNSNGPASPNYPSDAYIGIEPSYDLESGKSSREPWNVQFRDLLKPIFSFNVIGLAFPVVGLEDDARF
jgi:hypothetical protein